MKVAAVILAGGASRRMGSPKALLRLGSETLLERAIRVFTGTCDTVIVVLGHGADAIRAQTAGAPSFVVNPDPERGQLSSLQTGLAAIPEGIDAIAFCPVDNAAVQTTTVRALVDVLAGSRAVFAVPRHQGRRGHPVLFRAPILAEFLALPADGAARDVVHAYAERTEYVEVDDPGVVRDVDTPEDYEALLKALEGH